MRISPLYPNARRKMWLKWGVVIFNYKPNLTETQIDFLIAALEKGSDSIALRLNVT